jgi:phosphoribosyl 1,2-cyclic phosphodiesterase
MAEKRSTAFMSDFCKEQGPAGMGGADRAFSDLPAADGRRQVDLSKHGLQRAPNRVSLAARAVGAAASEKPMDEDVFRVRFWGVRGSLPVSGPQFLRYGGNTACIEMRCGPHTLIFDAGSGFRPAGEVLKAEGVQEVDLFFTHCHYDHIVGLPFFWPLYDPQVRISVWSGHLAGLMTTREMLSQFVRPPWFPVKLDICKANLDFHDFHAGDVLKPRKNVAVRTGGLNHPGGCIGYRVEWAGRAVAVISDTEHIAGELDASVLGLIRDADLVIYDCTYVEEEMQKHLGYGHSTWEQGVKLCEAAGAKSLAMFHHDPTRTDAQLKIIEQQAKRRFAGAFAAFDGQVINIPGSSSLRLAAGAKPERIRL